MGDWIDNGDGTHSFKMDLGEVITLPDGYLTGWGPDVGDISHLSDGYHEYKVSTPLGINVGEVPDGDLLKAFQENSTPFTRNFAGPGFVFNVEGYRNEINITTVLHALTPGVVERELTIVNGQYVIETYGFGQGAFRDINIFLSDAVWRTTDSYVLADLAVIAMSKGYHVDLFQEFDRIKAAPRCFEANAQIQTSLTTSIAISALRSGDIVLAYDASADKGRGALVPRRVTRLYRNTTTEWIRLRWQEDGVERELVATPGHHFLNEFGHFPRIDEMVKAGRATVVLASGALTEVTAERILYSAETAHMFERATSVGMVAGNAALQPAEIDAWQTYNIEVEDLHTYVAEGVRVHNTSGWFGALGTALFSSGPNVEVDPVHHIFKEDRSVHQGFFDSIGDAASNFMHFVGTAANAVIGGIAEAGRAVGGVINSGFEALLGPGGDSNRPDELARGSWHDDEGHQHWGSLEELDRAKANGTVDEVDSDPRTQGTETSSDRDGKQTGGNDSYGWSDLAHDIGKAFGLVKPVVLDLNGNGVEIATLDRSTTFLDSNGDGLQHRTAWAGSGDGVLFYDAGNDGKISEKREYVFTEWDPTAKDDMAALRSRFDSNGDGKLTAADAEFGNFKVMVTNADGSQTARTLAQLGITEITLKTDATLISFADGSQITGQTTFTMGGVVKTAAAVTLVSEADGHKLETTVDGAVTTYTQKDSAGHVLSVETSEVQTLGTQDAPGFAITTTNRYDDNGDGSFDRAQVITRVVVTSTQVNGVWTPSKWTETVSNYDGASAGGKLVDATKTTITSSTAGTPAIKTVVTQIDRDETGGGWVTQSEARTETRDVATNAGTTSTVIKHLARDGSVISQTQDATSNNGLTRVVSSDRDGDGRFETIETHTFTDNANGSRTELVVVTNLDGSARTAELLTTSPDGRTNSSKINLNGGDVASAYDTFDDRVITLNPDGSTLATDTRHGRDGTHLSQTVTTQSSDTLHKTSVTYVGAGDFLYQTTDDLTVIASSGDRTETTLVTNHDGSVFAKQEVFLAADKITGTTRVDLNHDGVLSGTDLVREVSVSAINGDITETNYDRNSGGSVRSKEVTVTSVDFHAELTRDVHRELTHQRVMFRGSGLGQGMIDLPLFPSCRS